MFSCFFFLFYLFIYFYNRPHECEVRTIGWMVLFVPTRIGFYIFIYLFSLTHLSTTLKSTFYVFFETLPLHFLAVEHDVNQNVSPASCGLDAGNCDAIILLMSEDSFGKKRPF